MMISLKRVILKQMKSRMNKFNHQMENIQTQEEMETSAHNLNGCLYLQNNTCMPLLARKK
ncbi:hypothetical protein E2C01_080582 [Portunus trituberculatus]|uniref:Uncharacterized protein n=1 Tax=Portunus trituberculatus TaxID=210409 RepID=A0A5B7IWI1_PORTR|nr:hypothetical protein [Portunus trituberculatus]